MADDNTGNNLRVPGVLLLFTVLGIALASRSPFEPTRPPREKSATSLYQPKLELVPSRLWQDPFSAIDNYIMEHKDSEGENEATPVTGTATPETTSSAGSGPSATPPSNSNSAQANPPKAPEAKSSANKTPAPPGSAPKAAPSKPPTPDTGNTLACNALPNTPPKLGAISEAAVRDNLRKLVENKSDKDKTGKNQSPTDKPKPIVLGVIVVGDPYAEGAELRRRWRYAVISALDVKGYLPEEPQYIGYYEPSGLHSTDEQRLPKRVPFEWFEDQEGHQLLVLWIDGTALGKRPIQGLEQLLALGGTRQQDKVEYKVVGPADSDSLKYMWEEATEPIKQNEREVTTNDLKDQQEAPAPWVHMFSGSATAPEDQLIPKSRRRALRLGAATHSPLRTKEAALTPETRKTQKTQKTQKTPLESDLSSRGIALRRTTATDDQLALLLSRELCLRGVIPGANPKKECAKLFPQDREIVRRRDYSGNEEATAVGKLSASTAHVALISEWDTAYGRALPAVLIKEFCKTAEKALDETACLRGRNRTGTKPSGDADKRTRKWAHTFSYLRGLDGETPMPFKSAEPTAKTRQDDSDKDAKNYTVERASGAGQFDYLRRISDELDRLNDDLLSNNQGRIRAIGLLGTDHYDKQLLLQALRPKFTDAVFFTTDLDARLLHREDNKWNRNLIVASSFGLKLNPKRQGNIPPFRNTYQTAVFLSTQLALEPDNVDEAVFSPRIFEIGRGMAFDFGDVPRAKLAEAGGIPIHPPGDSFIPFRFKTWVLSCFIIVLLVYALTAVPKRLLRAIVERCRAHPGFALVASAVVLGLLLMLDWKIKSVGHNGEPLSFVNGISAWPGLMLKAVSVVVGVIFLGWMCSALKKNAKALKQWGLETNAPVPLRTQCASLLTSEGKYLNGSQKENPLELAWDKLTIFEWGKEKKLLRHEGSTEATPSTDIQGAKAKPKSVQKLWDEYITHGAFPRRVLRTSVPFLAHLVLCILFFVASALPILPMRGLREYGFLLYVLFGASFLLTSFLMLLVVDATRLASRFIELLQETDSWPNTITASHRLQLGGGHCEREWAMLHVIASRTEIVSRLIFGPFVLLVLLLLSRVPYFDNWNMPLGLTLSYGLLAVYALYCAVLLRRKAEQARQNVLDRLNVDLIEAENGTSEALVVHVPSQPTEQPSPVDAASSTATAPSPSPSSLRQLIKSIGEIRQGAFLPLAQQPMVRVLLLPLGGLGLTLLDYFSMLG